VITKVDRKNSSRRRGFGLVELTIATLLLGLAMTIVAQTAGWLAAERRGADRRRRALQEAANLMERLSSRPWDELTPELARDQRLSEPTKAILRDGALEVAVAPEASDPKAKRIAIRIQWGDPSAGLVAPVRLVGWVHRRDRKGGKP
jgi:prepilin-type N-terminal cleavage/methylation domain-containing protein